MTHDGSEVTGPSAQEWGQLADHPLQTAAPMPLRQFARPVFEPGDGLVGDASAQLRFVPQREAEERASPRSVHGALLGFDLKLEASFDETGQRIL